MRAYKPLFLVVLCAVAAAGLLAGATAAGPRQNRPNGKSSSCAGQMLRGKKLYREHCAVCHFSSSTAKKVGPGLKELTKRGVYTDGQKVDDASLRAWIEKGGKNMLGFAEKLRPEEIRDLTAYLKTL